MSPLTNFRAKGPYKTKLYIPARHLLLCWEHREPSIMSFTGKYELQSHENFEPFMKALGKCLHALCAALLQQFPLISGIAQLC